MLNDLTLQSILPRRDLLQKDKLLLILLYIDDDPKSTVQVKDIGYKLGLREIRSWNVTAILNSAKGLAVHLPEGWKITGQGKEYLSNKDILEMQNIFIKDAIKDLRKHFNLITDKDTVEFLNEAIRCLESGLKRAAVVLSWVGAISVLYNFVVRNKLREFNDEARRRDAKWRNAKNIDDLTRIKEHDFLDILEAISIIGKNVKRELQNNCLHLRNSCGHPNTLQLGETRVAAHIEILILNVFSKY